MNASSEPLAVFPWPVSPEREALIRQAKASLNSPRIIKLVEGVYGSPGRILAFETPTFLCDYAPIKPENANSVASIAGALRFILDEDRTNPERIFNDEALLSKWFQAPVVYSHSEDMTGKAVAFR